MHALTIAVVAAALGGDARAVVARAVEAHGGPDALARARGARITARGTLHAPGRDLECVTTQVYLVPGQCKTTLRLSAPGAPPMTFVQLIDGDRFSLATDGRPREVTPAVRDELRTAVYGQWLWQLTPLLQTGVELELLAAAEERGRPAERVAVRRAGWKDVTLWFDRETGLLVKMSREGFGPSGQACTIEQAYGNFRTFGGVVRPTRTTVTRDGTPVLVTDVTDYQPLADIPPAEFAGP